MESKGELARQLNNLTKEQKIKNLDREQLDSASGGVMAATIGLGALAGLGAATATAAATAYSSQKADETDSGDSLEKLTKDVETFLKNFSDATIKADEYAKQSDKFLERAKTLLPDKNVTTLRELAIVLWPAK